MLEPNSARSSSATLSPRRNRARSIAASTSTAQARSAAMLEQGAGQWHPVGNIVVPSSRELCYAGTSWELGQRTMLKRCHH